MAKQRDAGFRAEIRSEANEWTRVGVTDRRGWEYRFSIRGADLVEVSSPFEASQSDMRCARACARSAVGAYLAARTQSPTVA